MADSRRRRANVGQRRNDGWIHLNAVAIGAVAVGVGALFVAVIGAIARDGGGGGGGLPGIDDGTPGSSQTVPAGQTGTPGDETPGVETPEPTEEEPEMVACGDPLVPLGKRHRLPGDCVPGDLTELAGSLSHGGTQRMRVDAANAFAELAAAAANDGFELLAVSAYRSYDAQVVAYEENKAIYGDE